MKANALIIFVATTLATSSLYSKNSPHFKLDWKWSQIQTEIDSATFSPNGEEVAVTKKYLWPDGHVAESFPEKFLDDLFERAKKEPRFGDPTITILENGKTKETLSVYGRNPVFTKDGKGIIFSAQVKPITGKRELLAGLEGNSINIFDRKSKKEKVLAKNMGAYLDDPKLETDSNNVYFEICDKVNGAFGGPVGIGVASIASGFSKPVIAPKKAFGYFCLISGWDCYSDGFVAIVDEPLDAGEMYMAHQYGQVLIVHGKQRDEKIQLGVKGLDDLIHLGPMVGSTVLFKSEKGPVTCADLNTYKTLDSCPKKIDGKLSPDGKFVLTTGGKEEFYTTSRATLKVSDAEGKIIDSMGSWGQIYGFGWANDSKHFFIIRGYEAPEENSNELHDELFIYGLKTD